ncbi:MAG: hypothetical protein HZB39_10080 [Planctomycetes bacterium]|nr:hypothetical protein [Planctomycetota bacterium]
MLHRSFFVASACAALLSAQGLVVVPAECAASDGNSQATLIGHRPARWQLVIDAAHAAPLHGREIRALLFRRDSRLTGALAPSSWNLVVRLGPAARESARALPDYAANAVSLSEVHRGPVASPASPSLVGTANWAASDTIRVDLAAPFRIATGGLIVDVEGGPAGAAFWPIDAIEDAASGAVTVVGSPCRPATFGAQSAWVERSELVPGRTATFELRGEPGSATWLLLGAQMLATPIDLSPIGAAGCGLHLVPFTALGAVVGAPDIAPEFGGRAWVDLHLPSDTDLLGATLAAQWFEARPSGFATSNALDCSLAAFPPSTGMALVVGQIDGAPVLRSYGLPVIGFVTD